MYGTHRPRVGVEGSEARKKTPSWWIADGLVVTDKEHVLIRAGACENGM